MDYEKQSVYEKQAILELLPLAQRQKLCKKLRQEQVDRYKEWTKREARQQEAKKEKKKNKKDTNVRFRNEVLIWDAIESFDDREGKIILFTVNSQ